jgi:excisionase family DNA binding protein
MVTPTSDNPPTRLRGTATAATSTAAGLPVSDKALVAAAAAADDRVRQPSSVPLHLEQPYRPVARVRKTGWRQISDKPVQSPRAEPLLDIPAVAARLGVSSKTVRRLIGRRELTVHRIGRLLRVSDEDLGSYIVRQRQTQLKELM